MKLHVVGVCLALWAYSTHAENLGVKAQTYAIDKDAREILKDAVREKTRTGDVDRFWKDYREKAIASIKHPTPLGVKTDYQQRAELRELKFVIPSDFRDEKGRVIVKRGTVIEPLKAMPLVNGLIFIDGRDQRQVDYAIARGRKEPLKIVLTAGSPYELRVRYQNQPWQGGKTIPFYFDQRKMIINTLQRLYGINLQSVPVVLNQKGDKLAIEFGMRGD